MNEYRRTTRESTVSYFVGLGYLITTMMAIFFLFTGMQGQSLLGNYQLDIVVLLWIFGFFWYGLMLWKGSAKLGAVILTINFLLLALGLILFFSFLSMLP
jgi:asparagine N-glycosylation enzyme membrane subunit Stt3